MRFISVTGIFIGLLSACSPVSNTALTKRFRSIETSLHDHTGFMLYDPEKRKEIFSYQASQYFTPASNTKILTLFAGLTILGDSVPAFQYIEKGDSLLFRGTGDPSLLYSETNSPAVWYSFLANRNKKLFLVQDNFYTAVFGPNWAWDDMPYTYSVERSAMPLYGNYFVLDQSKSSVRTVPNLFSYQVEIRDTVEKAAAVRDVATNKIYFHPNRETITHRWEIPFKTSAELTAQLLEDTLKKNVEVLSARVDFAGAKMFMNTPVDSVYKVMIQASDNFIAEQILMNCSFVLSDTINPEKAIRYMQKNYLHDLPDSLLWVDGSGLSRFNLFTPRSIVMVWDKLYRKIPRERLFPLLAVGGKAGTIRNYYKNEPPYIYGKTGTLRNNHILSGYIITKKGQTLIFSFMSNNFAVPTKDVRTHMESILKDIYTHY